MLRVAAIAAAALSLTPHAAAAADAVDAAPSIRDLEYLTGQGINDVILSSDANWGLLILENEKLCGEGCDIVRREFAAMAANSGGVLNYAYSYGQDIMQGSNGTLIEVRQQWNVTEIPSLVLFPAGPKKLSKGLTMPASAVLSLVRTGPKMLLNQMRAFVPGLVDDVRGVGARTLEWLTRPAPALPRLLLLTARDEHSSALKALSTVLASRMVVGQARSSDKALTRLFGTGNTTALFLSPPHPAASGALASVKQSLEPLTDGVLGREWTRYTGDLRNASYTDLLNFAVSGGGGGGGGSSGGGATPHAPVPRLRSAADFDAACGGADVTVCFVGVLPASELTAGAVGDGDGDGDGALAALSRAADRAYLRLESEPRRGGLSAVRLPLAFAVVDGDAQAAWAASLKASAMPALVAVNPRKRVFSVMKRSSAGGRAFGEGAIHDFVVAVMDKAARVPTAGAAASKRGSGGGDDDDDVEGGEDMRVTFETVTALPALKTEAKTEVGAAAAAKKKKPAAKPAVKTGAGAGTGGGAGVAASKKKPAATVAAAKSPVVAAEGASASDGEL